MHEDLGRADHVVGPSDRKFGVTIAAVCGIIAAWKLYHWSSWAYLWAGLAMLVLGLAALRPPSLALVNRAWLRLGLLLHRLVNPIVMAILFYLTVMPTGLLLRLFGKDVLGLKFEKTAESYWIVRTDERPISQSMRQQF